MSRCRVFRWVVLRMEYILFTTKKINRFILWSDWSILLSACWQDQLHGVVEVVAGGSAFAALRGDGEVITWGHCRWGGDSNQVADELRPAKVAVEKIWGGWCVMVLWRFGWLVGLWDAFMTCYLWEKKLSKSCLFDVKDSNGQRQALLWPRLSFPVIFNVVSFMHPSILWQRVPTTLSRLRTFIRKRATCATTRGQAWVLPEVYCWLSSE